MKKYCFRVLGVTSRKGFLWGLVVLELLFVYAFHGLFSFSVEKLQAISGGFGIPDTEFYYSYNQLQTLFSHYGDAGRILYFKLQTIDMIYPLVYSTLLASLLYLVLKKSRFKHLVLLPFAAACFDYAENIFLHLDLLMFPAMKHWMVSISGIFTLVKWSLVYLSVLFFLIAVIRILILKFNMRS